MHHTSAVGSICCAGSLIHTLCCVCVAQRSDLCSSARLHTLFVCSGALSRRGRAADSARPLGNGLIICHDIVAWGRREELRGVVACVAPRLLRRARNHTRWRSRLLILVSSVAECGAQPTSLRWSLSVLVSTTGRGASQVFSTSQLGGGHEVLVQRLAQQALARWASIAHCTHACCEGGYLGVFPPCVAKHARPPGLCSIP